MKKIDYVNWAAEPDLSRLQHAHELLTKQPAAALYELQSLAESGSIMSMIYLGDVYKCGRFTKADLVESEIWYRRSANAGSLLGYYSLGRLYFKLKRYYEAAEAFKIAAEQEYVPAIHFLGRMYVSGKGVEKDVAMGEQFLEFASRNGSILAKGVLAYLFTHSGSSPRRVLRGIYLYISMWIELFIVVLIEGKTSDRLR